MHIHIKSVHEWSIVLGKEDAPPAAGNKPKQISNRKRPSSKRLSNISLFDVSLMHVASFGCGMFPMQWLNYIQGWLLKLTPPKYTRTSRGSVERPGRGSPPPLSGKCRSSCLPLISSGVEECPAPPAGWAPGPRPRAWLLTAALLSEKAAQDKVHHAGGLVRAPPQRVRQLLQVSLDVLLQKPFWVPYHRFDDVHQVLWGQEDKMSSKVLFVEGMASAGEVRRGEEPVPSQRTVSRRDVSVIQTVEATENRGAEMNVVWKRLPSILSMWNKELEKPKLFALMVN